MNFNTEFICKLSFFLVSFLFSRQKKYKDKSRQITSDWSQVIQILFLLLSNFNFPAKNDCNWRKTQKLISKLEVYISLYLLLLSFQFSAKKKKNSSNHIRIGHGQKYSCIFGHGHYSQTGSLLFFFPSWLLPFYFSRQKNRRWKSREITDWSHAINSLVIRNSNPKLYIPCTINIWKKLLTKAI